MWVILALNRDINKTIDGKQGDNILTNTDNNTDRLRNTTAQ